jgi:hypothetical protein
LKFVVLFVLAALWAVVLVPPLLRARTSRSSDSIGDFNYRLGVLSRTGGFSRRRASRRQLPALAAPLRRRPSMAPGPMSGARVNAPQRAAKRRRDITLGLVVAAVVTLAVAAVANSSSVWMLQVLVDVMLVGYLGLVAWFRSTPVAARGARVAVGNVQYLAEHRGPELALQPAPVVLRRTGSS